MNGWIILDKPSGISSAQAVAKVKKLVAKWLSDSVAKLPSHQATKPRPIKIGHAGTLDPLASGILPLALGEATKTISYMVDTDKAYAFTVIWGEQRDTDDALGKVVATSPKRPTEDEIRAILPQFIGRIQQTPPAYSAIKIDGERAYALARAGEAVELKAREVRVDALQITSPLMGEVATRSGAGGGESSHTPLPNPPPQGGRESTTFICHCGKGTYIRSLARDMGKKLGCFGHISALRRLKVRNFTENDAISLEVLEEMVHKGRLELLPVESVLDDILALDITPHQAMRLQRGQPVPVTLVSEETVLSRCEGKPVAICQLSQGEMKPIRVFNL